MCDDDVVAEERPDSDDLDGFSPAAQRAVTRAAVEAQQLGHDRVGTEHLLLGLVADEAHRAGDPSAAATAMTDAGLTFPATRHKVREATARSSRGAGNVDEVLPRTARADRALTRAVRFSHERRAVAVDSEHLLLGVLDVEGTAGQVLRGLGVDVDQLRATLDAAGRSSETAADDESRSPVAEVPTTPANPATCPSCRASLDHEMITSRAVAASGDEGPLTVIVYSCWACDRFLGLTSPVEG